MAQDTGAMDRAPVNVAPVACSGGRDTSPPPFWVAGMALYGFTERSVCTDFACVRSAR